MKKLIIFLILSAFLAVSCSSLKKAENDADILPDEDAVDVDETDEDDEDAIADDDEIEDIDLCESNPCENFANVDGTCLNKEDGSFECGCLEGYFWGYLGCKKIAFPNICTGWKTCYNNEREIDCPKPGEPFYGQDAQYAELGYCIEHNFSKETYHHDDIAIDLNPDRIAVDDLLHLEWTYEYVDTGANTWEEAIKYCEDFEYAERTGWRLASLKELMLSNVLDDYNEFWSSDEYAGDDSKAWIGASNGRRWTVNSKTSFHRSARCVRGEPIETTVSFDTLGKLNEVVAFDYENGLAWQLYAGHEDTLEDALAYCENSTYSGFSDWRVPNAHELASIVNLEKHSPASDLPLRNLTLNNSWTSTNQNFRTSGVNLNTGEISSIDKDNHANILCVRNEPCKRGWFWNGEKCVKSPCTEKLCKNNEHSDGICYLNDFESYACGCVDGYFWDGEKCSSPCDPNPCGNDKNSTGECTAISIDYHKCGCNDGYFWDEEKCLENPCNGVSCSQFEHGAGECRPADAFNYSCGCEEGFYWWGKDKGCTTKKPAAINICTGQHKCYDNEKEIPCPAEGEEFFGQDVSYARLGYCIPQSFSIDNSVAAEPVVIDNNLGLMWQQKIPPAEELYVEEVIAYCDNLVYGGYDDWRLPSLEDFVTIADYGRYDPAVNTEYFPDSGSFWTASNSKGVLSPYPFNVYEELYKIFDFAKPSTRLVTTYSTGGGGYPIDGYPYTFDIRCVRGNTSDASGYFMPETLGENLMWSDGTLIVLRKSGMNHTWSEALKYCSKLDYVGISDWRLPNFKEFKLGVRDKFVWSGYIRSSTTKIFDQTSDHLSSDKGKTLQGSILCVTSNPCGEGTLWNGKKCVKNPCDPNPCESEEGLNKTCKVIDEETYFCGCGKCMYDVEHSNGKCYENTMDAFYCGCEEGYRWINWNTYYGCYED